MSLQVFCEKIEKVATLDQLWPICIRYFSDLGFDKVSYQYVPPMGDQNAGKIRFYSDGLPQNWRREYVEGKLYLVDPIPGLAQTATAPFYWRDVVEVKKLAEPEKDFLGWMEKQGVLDGLAIRVFGPNHRNGFVALGFQGQRPDLSLAQILELQCACQVGHMTYIRLTNQPDPALMSLTKREKEVLSWVAKGKSNSVIGDIMGISAHTVDAYLRRIYLKLGVSDRISAAIKGLGAGLISSLS